MVDLSVRGRCASLIESRHYRFRIPQVYRCAAPAVAAKALRCERVKFEAGEPAAHSHTVRLIAFRRYRSSPRAAQYALLPDEMTFVASDLNTTLVLEAATADFSTDAGNSALIIATRSPRCPASARCGLPGGEEQKQ
jgi:hypothetical protein